MKKVTLTIIGIIVAHLALFASDSNKLTIVVKNMQNTNGQVQITLFDSPDNWLNTGTTKTAQVTDLGEVIFEFDNLPNGDYAISVIHDENENKGLDTGIFGIPTEDYGFSNDARGKFGPASFEDSKIVLNGDRRIVINVQ